MVAFLPLDSNQIGWVPLGPGDVYVPRYYDQNWQPHYLTRADLTPTQLVNLGIPGAVTVVPVDAFGRVIDPRVVRRIDGSVLASVRPTLEPLLLTPLRNAAINSAWGRGKIGLPPGIAKKLDDTRVFVGNSPNDSRFRKDLAKSLRVERVSDDVKNRKFQVRDDRQAEHQADQARKQELNRLAAEAAKGNREAAKQARQLEHEQKQAEQKQKQSARTQERIEHKPKAERVGNPAATAPRAAPAPRNVERPQPQQRQQAQPRPQPQPRQQVQAPQHQKHEMKQQSAPAPGPGRGQGAAKQEKAPGPPANAGGQSQGGGKGKGKKP